MARTYIKTQVLGEHGNHCEDFNGDLDAAIKAIEAKNQESGSDHYLCPHSYLTLPPDLPDDPDLLKRMLGAAIAHMAGSNPLGMESLGKMLGQDWGFKKIPQEKLQNIVPNNP